MAPQRTAAGFRRQNDRTQRTWNLMNDLRFAFRQLRKSPGFSILAILTLALGIGVNSAIFSLMHDLFLRGLPFSEPDRVVRLYGEAMERKSNQLPFSVLRFWFVRIERMMR